jgi:hypothetical protein
MRNPVKKTLKIDLTFARLSFIEMMPVKVLRAVLKGAG